MEASNNVRVLYFGALSDNRFVGVREEEVQVTEGTDLEEFTQGLCQRHPVLSQLLRHLRLAVNADIPPPGHVLRDGDVVALLPPVAGGADPYCRITRTPLDVHEVVAAVSGPTQGGIAVFIGTVRGSNNGHPVDRLTYDTYPEMAVKTLLSIIERCQAEHTDVRVAVAHRYGELNIGDAAVVVAASAPHRAEAFLAARQAIELVKEKAPFWKQEFFPDGDEWVGMLP